MANDGGSSPLDIHCVFVETNLETRLALLVHKDENTSDFKEKLCKEHNKCFPQVGEINISALKVKRRREFFHLPDSMNMIGKAFEGIKRDWFMYVDAVRVEKGELPLAIMDVDQNYVNPELLDKKKEIAVDSVGHLTLAEGLKTEVKKTKKRKSESLDGNKSRKKSSLDINRSASNNLTTGPATEEKKSRKKISNDHIDQSAVAGTTTSIDIVNADSIPRKEILGNPLVEAIQKENEMGENSINDAGRDKTETNNLTSHLADQLGTNSNLTTGEAIEKKNKRKKSLKDHIDQSAVAGTTTSIDIVNADSISRKETLGNPLVEAVQKENEMGEKPINDAERDKIETEDERADGSRLTPKASNNLHIADLLTYPENQLEASSNFTTGPATKKNKKRKKSSKDHIDQSEVAATTTSVDAVSADSISRRETLGNSLEEAVQKENEMGEKSINDAGRDKIETDSERADGSRLTPKASNNLHTAELTTYPENQLEASSNLTTGLATEKRKKRKTSSKDHIDQSTVVASTTSVDIANADSVSRRETLGNPLVEAIQKENEMGEKSISDAGRDKIETDNLTSDLANQLGTNSVLTTTPVTEKKKRGKKSSKDHIDQSSAAATTTSREIVNGINRVPENVDPVNATPESFTTSGRGNVGNPFVEARQKENAIDEKIDDDLGSGKAVPSVAVNTPTNNFVSYPENQLETNSGLTAGPATEKKRKQKKSSKDHTTQSTATATITREIVNQREKVSGSIDRADVTSESYLQTENETADKFIDDVGPTNNLPISELADTQVQESKTLDHSGKFMDENRTCEHEVTTDKAEKDAAEVKSVRSTKKKTSRKAKTPAKEDTQVASGAQNVEPIIKVVDREEPDNVIRDVLDSLQQKNETEENLGKSGKKSSKKSKKKDSSNIVETQVLPVEVNNGVQKEVSLINNPKDTDASFTPAKKDTGSHLKKSIEDNTEDNNPSKRTLKENADMGDNFASSQKNAVGGKKQDQVTSRIKSKKEKKSLDLHPGGSIYGSLSSMKPKERKGRVQPASSGISHSQSKVKDDHNGSKTDRSHVSMKGAVDNKKEAVKESSNSVTVNKSRMNFFKDAEWDSTEDESNKAASDVSTKSPSDSSSDDDSDVTSMSRKQGNIPPGGTNRFSGSLKDILRSSKSFKMAKLRASQSQPEISDDEIPPLDCVPDSQAN